jgi:hypothetical protein
MVKKSKTGSFGMCCALVGFVLVVLVLQATYTEGFSSYGSPIHNNTAESPWVTDAKTYNASISSTKRSNYKGTPVPLQGEEMFFFKENQFKPECCPATYSSSTGCACTSDDQRNYLNERGGNRTLSSNY